VVSGLRLGARLRGLRRGRGARGDPLGGEAGDGPAPARAATGLEGLLVRLAAGLGLAAGLLILTLDHRAAGEVALGVGHLAVVGAAAWGFGPVGRWATVAGAAAGWSLAGPYAATLGRPWAFVETLGGEAFWWGVALRGGALASVALTVSAFRGAARRFLQAEDTLVASLARERDTARRDRLTRLWNAGYLHEALEREIARCRRYGRPFGLLLLDLDGFKAVNDTGGHAAGDLLLQAVARLVRDHCRATDIPARLGGDEFAIILPEASSLTVPRYADKLVRLVAAAPPLPGLPRVTASVGGVAFTRAPASAKAALAAADAAMYAAKREGKNRAAVRAEGLP
jgi:diguanylate cyclase (GGDEF)-like protein